jgi:co-chaperonin GroES (HSP10)
VKNSNTTAALDYRVASGLDGPVEEIVEEEGTRTAIRPLRDRLYVQRLFVASSKGGIIFPKAFKFGFSARQKINAISDVFRARVLAIGPEVRELVVGDEILVHSYADGDGSTLWTGVSVGEKDRMFIEFKDVVCGVEA